MPVGQWVHIEITVALGEDSPGTWDLTDGLPDQPAQAFRELRCVSPDWHKLDWLGFSSTANHETVFYVDNIVLENSAAR